MIALFSRRAEEFASAVDGEGSNDPSISTLMTTVDDLRSVAFLEPREAFREGLRVRLLAEAEATWTRVPTRASRAPRRAMHRRSPRGRLAAAAAALALLGGTAGVATAAQSARPGDALYPIKRAIERFEAAFAAGSTDKASVLLGQATGRLVDLRAEVESRPTESVAPLSLVEFADEAQRGTDLLLQTYLTTGDPGVVVTVREFAASSMEQLAAIRSSGVTFLDSELATAAQTLEQIDAHAAELCPSCTDLPTLQVPASLQATGSSTVGAATTTQSTPRPHARTRNLKQPGSALTSRSRPKAGPTSGVSGSVAGSSGTSGPLDPITSAAGEVVSTAVNDLASVVDTALALPTSGLPGL